MVVVDITFPSRAVLKQVSSVIFDLILLGWFQDIINAPWCNDAMTGCIAIASCYHVIRVIPTPS